MWKPHKSTCPGCGEGNVWITTKCRGLCTVCESKRKPRTRIKKLSEKRKERIKGGGSEFKMFCEIWDERPHVCQVTDEPIKEFSVWNFMHVLAKGPYGRYRLKKENVLLVLPWVHDKYDNGDRSDPMFKEVNRLHDKLESEYYEETKII